VSQGSTLLSVSKVPKQPFWKYWPITCKFFTELHRNLPCGVCSHHTFSQNVRLSFKPLCYQSKLRWHWLNFFAKTKKTRFPIQTSLQLLSATKMHVKDVKDLTKISVPQCENGKKVITERCCFPRFKFIKVFQWSDISPTVWHMCALCVFRCADTILLWKWLKWTSWCQNGLEITDVTCPRKAYSNLGLHYTLHFPTRVALKVSIAWFMRLVSLDQGSLSTGCCSIICRFCPCKRWQTFLEWANTYKVFLFDRPSSKKCLQAV